MKGKLNLISMIIIVTVILAVLILIVFYPDLRPYLQQYHPYPFFLLLASGLVLKLPYQISVGAGIMLLLVIPLLLHRGDDFVSQVAIYAFYFLGIGLTWGVVDHLKGAAKGKSPSE